MELTKTHVINIINDYVDDVENWENIKPMTPFVGQKAYSLWAAEKMIKLIEETDKGLECTIEQFMIQMDKYSTKNKYGYRFSVARDAAQYILDQILYQKYVLVSWNF